MQGATGAEAHFFWFKIWELQNLFKRSLEVSMEQNSHIFRVDPGPGAHSSI